MFRALAAAFAALSRFMISAPLFAGAAAWDITTRLHTLLWPPQPAPAADVLAGEAEAALAEDNASQAPAEERRALREAQRILAAEKAAAAAPRAKLSAADLADIRRAAVKAEPELAGIPVPGPSSRCPEAQQVRMWWYNSLAGGAVFSPRPTLDGLPDDVRAWAKSMDRRQRLSLLRDSVSLLQHHIMSPEPKMWSETMPPVSPERDQAFKAFLSDRRARIATRAAEQRRQRAAQDPRNDLGESYGPRLEGTP